MGNGFNVTQFHQVIGYHPKGPGATSIRTALGAGKGGGMGFNSRGDLGGLARPWLLYQGLCYIATTFLVTAQCIVDRVWGATQLGRHFLLVKLTAVQQQQGAGPANGAGAVLSLGNVTGQKLLLISIQLHFLYLHLLNFRKDTSSARIKLTMH